MRAPLPDNEEARLAALRAYDILDTLPEPPFDDIVQLASRICETPIAAITLVDAERQWFKARMGLEFTETHRDIAFCAHTIRDGPTLIVPDATRDPRFADNPLVTGQPAIRFYAGAPLRTAEGHALGTLCVLDPRARALARDQREALEALGRQVMTQLELRRALARLGHTLAEKARVQQALDEARARLEQQVAERTTELATTNERLRAEAAEHRRTAETLERQRRMVQAVFDNIEVGIVACDADGVLALFNRATERFHGLEQRAILSDRWAAEYDLYLADGETRMQPEEVPLFRALNGEHVRDVEMVIKPARGPARTLLASGQVMHDAEGRKLGAVVAMHDITELRRAERRAREAQARLEHVVASNPVVLYTLEWPTGRATWLSESFPRLTGHALEDALGQVLWGHPAIHPRDRDAVRAARQALETTGHAIYEYRFRRRDGRYIWIRDESRLERDGAGTPIQVIGATVDVTNLKQLERIRTIQLAATRALAETPATGEPLAALLQAVTETLEWDLGEFWSLEPGGRRLRRTVSWTRPELEAFDEQCRDLTFVVGEGLAGSVWTGGRSLWSANVSAETGFLCGPLAQAAGLQAVMAFPVRGPAGRSGMLLFFSRERVPRNDQLLTALEDLGVRIGAFLEQRRQREALVRSEKLADLGRLAAGIAHELRNPLTVIRGRVDIFTIELQAGRSPDPDRLREGLGKLREAADRMGRIVDSLSTSSKPSRPEPQRLDLGEFLRATAELVAYAARQHRVRLAVEVPDQVPAVLGDRSQVTQILVNLANNAIEAMAEAGGQLTLRARVEGPQLRVDVADTGPGIPPDVLERIWEPFYTTKGEGTGLGLSIVRGLLIAQPGATLTVDSRVGEGTTFTLSMPIASEPAAAP